MITNALKISFYLFPLMMKQMHIFCHINMINLAKSNFLSGYYGINYYRTAMHIYDAKMLALGNRYKASEAT